MPFQMDRYVQGSTFPLAFSYFTNNRALRLNYLRGLILNFFLRGYPGIPRRYVLEPPTNMRRNISQRPLLDIL